MTEGQALLTRVAMSVLAFLRKLAIPTGETKAAIHLPNVNGKSIQFVPFLSIPPQVPPLPVNKISELLVSPARRQLCPCYWTASSVN